ncbi:hypothetical protein AB0A05_17015 [Streptomyces sp. NPDC046374]
MNLTVRFLTTLAVAGIATTLTPDVDVPGIDLEDIELLDLLGG